VDFDIRHSFQAPAREVACAMLDLDYQRSLDDVAQPARRRIELQEERPDGTVLRRTRYELIASLPRRAQSFLGGAAPAWTEEAVYHPGDLLWEWEVVPHAGAGLLQARGRIALQDTPAGSSRTISGRVKVNVPLYGPRVEKVIVQGLKEGYDREAERLRTWLQRR
jgi:hypothetical protein